MQTISKEYKFTKNEENQIKAFAKGNITSRKLGTVLGVSHTQAIKLAGRYFHQLFAKGKIIIK